ncbi:MAG TPA: pyruvate kinase [Anaerolineae bacterium]
MPPQMEMHRLLKRTKIVATVGPASDNEETLRRMILAGLDVVRINFSHSDQDHASTLIELIRRIGDEMRYPLAILGDLRGPRIRVGKIKDDSVELKAGQQLVLTPEAVVGNSKRVPVSYPDLAGDVEVGSTLLLDDGNIELQVETISPNGDIVCSVAQGNTLSSQRGINLPGRHVSLPSITRKDYADIDFAIEHEFDFLALSFVQSAADVRQLNAYLAEKGVDIPVIAKIEKQGALDDIEAITHEAYGVMVARGDMALEMSIQDVPIAQKRIIAACREAAIPVITATQMLESMMELPKPTRAEATDVANAILDGTDALMLSGETAIGNYPVKTVAMMTSIAARIEKAWITGQLPGPAPLKPPTEPEPTVAYAGHLSAKSLAAKAIVTYTASGATARRVVCHRPLVTVLALTASSRTQRRLNLSWGVECALTEYITETDRLIAVARQQTQDCGVASPGDTIIMLASTPPYGEPGRTNTLKIERIPEASPTEEAQGD